MGKIIDITGQKFGRLTVIKRADNSKTGATRWLCRCECGNTAVVLSYELRSGSTTSCGCYWRERVSEANSKHKLRNHPLFTIWASMKQRCYNANVNAYRWYGGRGITVYSEWQSDFKAFYDWAMSNGWQEGLTIDRIDVNGNYEPSNCRWVTMKTQCNNRNSNLNITFRGKTQNLKQWSNELGIGYPTLYKRIKTHGWSIEQAFTTPVKRKDDN